MARGQDEEARGQGRDDGRDAQQPDQRVVEAADQRRRQRARPAGRAGSCASCRSMIFMATAPASVMVAGIDRSTLPGPRVITNIWPMADDDREGGEGEAPRSAPARRPRRPVNDDRWRARPRARRRRPRARASRSAASARHRRASARLISSAQRQHEDQDRALRADLPVGRDAQEGQERAGERQRHGADHRADRRDAAADELAAAQDHAGDRQQRVAQRRCWRRPRW